MINVFKIGLVLFKIIRIRTIINKSYMVKDHFDDSRLSMSSQIHYFL